MNLQERINLLARLGEYMLSDSETWVGMKERAHRENSWFLPEFIDRATINIASAYLKEDALVQFADSYRLPATSASSKNFHEKKIGIVMAGNIPMVGFHDLICVFLTGHKALIKTSSKDDALIKHLVNVMASWNSDVGEMVGFSEMLKGCDAYIATGSNNTAGYFEYYFGKYPNIIRRNRTSVAVLTANESTDELSRLADDVYLYFGLGCRSISKLYVPQGYDFAPLLNIFKKYNYLADHHKYKNNYDYNLALHILNKKFYMSNESLLLLEDPALFSPISQLNYEFYSNERELLASLQGREELQCIVGKNFIPFGQSQYPSLTDYADGVDTVRFLTNL